MADPVFVDTSGLYAFIVANDTSHPAAVDVFERLRARQAPLVSTSYVLVELFALIGRRIGLGAVRRVREDLTPALDVVWVDRALHDRALDLLLQRGKRDLSLVDVTGFLVARDRGIDQAFAFDAHFEAEGFRLP